MEFVVRRARDLLVDGDATARESSRTRKTSIAFIARGEFWVNNLAHVVVGLTTRQRSTTRFLAYAVESTDVSGSSHRLHASRSSTQQSSLRLPVVAPVSSEQSAIAAVLGALDDKIESNRRLVTASELILDAEWHAFVGGREQPAWRSRSGES